MAIPLKYSLRNLRVRWVSTLLTALGIALVTFVFVLVFALANGLKAAFVATGHPRNVLVLRSGATAESHSMVSYDSWTEVRELEAIEERAGTKLISRETLSVINHRKADGGKANITVRGVTDLGFELRDGLRVEPRRFAPQMREALVGRALVSRFQGLEVGRTVKIRNHDYAIVGIIDAGGQAYESEIWCDLSDLEETFSRKGMYSSLLIRATDVNALKGELSQSKFNFKVEPEKEYYRRQSESGLMIQAVGTFLAMILGAGAVFGAMNTMYASVAARIREIATMRVLGFGKWSILTAFLFESCLIALVGGVLGACLGLTVHNMSTGTANWVTFSEIAFKFRVTPQLMAQGVVLSVIMGFVGGLFPARQAAAVPIARALREL